MGESIIKKVISSILILNTLIILLPEFSKEAHEFLGKKQENIYYVPKDEVNSNLEESLNKIINMNNKSRTAEYSKYDYEYLDTKYPLISGYAAGQPSNGTKFSTGGGFYWTEGGKEESVSVSIAGKIVSVLATLGKVSDKVTGYYCAAPTTTKYYRLYVTKK